MNNTLSRYIVDTETSVLEAMETIEIGSKGVVYVCKDNVLQGVVTDGDVRRFILKNGDLQKPVSQIANKNVKCINKDKGIDSKEYMLEMQITSIPIVDSNKHVVAIDFLHGEKVYKNVNLRVPVVIMAGGKGTRLLPYTNVLPKPLIPIGEKTITEHIIDKFKKFNCAPFSIIVNYKKDLIKAYFQEQELGDIINFVEEKEFLGTGGGLHLLKGEMNTTFFMTNCDVLVDDDYSAMFQYHCNQQNLITVVCAVKKFVIPYGTISLNDNGDIEKLEEKPKFSFITNTGLYIIEPRFLDYIAEGKFIHITDVIQQCLEVGEKVGVYPISESSWFDMGEFKELDRMRLALCSNLNN